MARLTLTPLECADPKSQGQGGPNTRRKPRVMQILEVKLNSQLDLPRIKHRSRRSVQWIRRPFREEVRRPRTPKRHRVLWAEIRSAVHGIEEPDIRRVEKVEGFRDQLKVPLLAERNRPPDPQIHC